MSAATTTPAADSPLARLKANYAARQEADKARYIDLWDDGSLVARVGTSSEVSAARGVMRIMTSMAAGPEQAAQLDVTTDDLADVIAAVTVSLHERDEDGTLTDLADEAGNPLRFDSRFGALIGYPQATLPRDAVLLAFTRGDPPAVDAVALMVAVTYAAGVVTGRTAQMEAALGEASALRS